MLNRWCASVVMGTFLGASVLSASPKVKCSKLNLDDCKKNEQVCKIEGEKCVSSKTTTVANGTKVKRAKHQKAKGAKPTTDKDG